MSHKTFETRRAGGKYAGSLRFEDTKLRIQSGIQSEFRSGIRSRIQSGTVEEKPLPKKDLPSFDYHSSCLPSEHA